jgi:geranylgeranyl diphosphate synthase, type II
VGAAVDVEAYLERVAAIIRADLARRQLAPSSTGERWLDDLVFDYPSRGGKALRPTLCLATCEAFGGRAGEVLPYAVAIELLHNAFLVHDDIQDESLLRRGRATLHELHGVPVVADHVAVVGGRIGGLVADEFARMTWHTVVGQATELGWMRDGVLDLTADDYLDMVMRKTCWYTTIHPLRVGALVGSWGRADLDSLVRFGFLLGAAFQIQDDVLNLVGRIDTYGKEIGGDLVEGKRTLIVIHALNRRGPVRDDVVEFLAVPRAQRSAGDALRLRDALERSGSIEYATQFARGIAAEAQRCFDAAFGSRVATSSGALVRALVDYMVDRVR